MAFSSTIFIFIFMPIVFGLIYLIPKIKFQNYILLISSLIFYSWGEPVYVFLMIEMVLINYLLAFSFNTKDKNVRRGYLILSIMINVGILIIFKYTGFILDNFNDLFNLNIPIPTLAFPLGISFFIFHMISYLVDVYRGQAAPEKNFFKLLLYISFFPKLISGPIVKYIDIENQIDDRE
ncbi:MAG: MBOAT family protein, partial [Oscillospiraceae bacterium]|nr:MBOAT family protein [Oscillospiraceae bacterium]